MPKFNIGFKQGYVPSGHANADMRTTENVCIKSEMQRQEQLHANKGIKPKNWKPLKYIEGFSTKGEFTFNGGQIITEITITPLT